MGHATDQQPQQPTPVADDANATPAQLQQRAAADYAAQHAATQAHQAQGGTGVRQGVLPGGGR
jgi:hypothetical protein